jgi:hypothetical protein
MAHFTLPRRAMSKAVASEIPQEVWYLISGHGRNVVLARQPRADISSFAPCRFRRSRFPQLAQQSSLAR